MLVHFITLYNFTPLHFVKTENSIQFVNLVLSECLNYLTTNWTNQFIVYCMIFKCKLISVTYWTRSHTSLLNRPCVTYLIYHKQISPRDEVNLLDGQPCLCCTVLVHAVDTRTPVINHERAIKVIVFIYLYDISMLLGCALFSTPFGMKKVWMKVN